MRLGESGSLPVAFYRKSFFQHYAVYAAVGVFALAASARPASAQVLFTLASNTSTVTAGGETYFTGTITNNSSVVVYLNGLQFVQEPDTTPSSGVWSTDDSPFFNNTPATLAANGGTFTGQIFGIQASNALTPTSEFDGTVAVIGGSSSTSDSVLAGPLSFLVTASNTGLTPEPQSLPLLIVGMTALGGLARRRIVRRL